MQDHGVYVHAHISFRHPFFYLGGGVLSNCSGKTLSVLHTKPHTSPSLSLSSLLPQAAVFLSWPGNWSQAVFSLSLPHKQELADLPKYTHILFLSVSALSHTRLAVDCVLTSFWTRDWGAAIPTLLLGCCDCVFTLQCESRLTVGRNAFMVRLSSCNHRLLLSFDLLFVPPSVSDSSDSLLVRLLCGSSSTQFLKVFLTVLHWFQAVSILQKFQSMK